MNAATSPDHAQALARTARQADVVRALGAVLDGNEAAVPAAAGTTSPAAADVRSREVVRSRDRDVR